MKYLLLGNGPLEGLEKQLESADFVVQLNDCPHAHLVPPHLTKAVFLLNSGPLVSPVVIERFLQKRKLLPEAQIILTRNIPYCRMKERLLFIAKHPMWEDYVLSDAWKELLANTKVSNISFLRTLMLDLELVAEGMPFPMQPSTGLIAYKWLASRLRRGDTLELNGFTFTGWQGHAWSVEKKMIKSIP